jgi:hypothetical protein
VASGVDGLGLATQAVAVLTPHADAAHVAAQRWGFTAYLDWPAGHRDRLGI